jgi:hypothetical protein
LQEPVTALYAFVKEALQPGCEFQLYTTPPRVVLDAESAQTLHAAHLVPSAVVRISSAEPDQIVLSAQRQAAGLVSPAFANKPSSAALVLQTASVDAGASLGHVLGAASAAAATSLIIVDQEDSTKRPAAPSGKSGSQFLRLSLLF